MLPSWFSGLSYPGLFLVLVATGAGLPLPEDAVVLGAGYLVHRGAIALAPTLALAFIGVLIGDLVLYGVGRRASALARRLPPERLARAERWFARWGAGAVVVARFVAGVRAAAYVTAGALRMPLGRFLAVDAAAALANVPLLVLAGRQAGPRLDEIAAAVAHGRLYATAAAAAILVAALLYRLVKRRRAARPS